MKKCKKCGEIKDFSEFRKRKDSPDGYRNECKKCQLEYQRKYVNGEIKKKEYQDGDGKKQCRSCMKVLGAENFGKAKNTKDGLKSYCKFCKRKESARWRNKNDDYGKKYREEHKEKLDEYNKEYRQENKDELTEKKKKYVAENKDLVAERKKKWYENNRKRILEKKKERYELYKDEIIARELERRKNNIQDVIKKSLRNRVRRAAQRKRAGSAVRDLGCTVIEFKKHIESLFVDGMTWENCGEWHFDHVVPLSYFDLTDRDQFKKACHYTNIQPLWAEDNLRKGASLPDKMKE